SRPRRRRRRESRPCCRVRSPCARCRSTIARTRDAVSTREEPLEEVVQALERPLAYLAARGFRGVEHTRLPLDAIAERIARARREARGDVAQALAALDEIVAALRGEPAARPELLRRAHALLPALREGAAPREQRPSAAAVEAALAALAAPAHAVRSVGPKRAAELARFRLP